MQFASTRYSSAQINFAEGHKLVIAMHWAVIHFRAYLMFSEFDLFAGEGVH